MRAEDVRSFLDRDWAQVARARTEYWRGVARAHGGEPSARIADALREHAAHYAVPEAVVAERVADWAHHLDLKRRIDAASTALRR